MGIADSSLKSRPKHPNCLLSSSTQMSNERLKWMSKSQPCKSPASSLTPVAISPHQKGQFYFFGFSDWKYFTSCPSPRLILFKFVLDPTQETSLENTYQIIKCSSNLPPSIKHNPMPYVGPSWLGPCLLLHFSIWVFSPSPAHSCRFYQLAIQHVSTSGPLYLSFPLLGTLFPQSSQAHSATSFRPLLHFHLWEAFSNPVFGMAHIGLLRPHYLSPSPYFILNYNIADMTRYACIHLGVCYSSPPCWNARKLLGLCLCYSSLYPYV